VLALHDASLAEARAKVRALYELGKPNLSLLVVVTAVIGFFLASRPGDGVGWLEAVMLVVGTSLTAMGACAANMCREAEVDARMARTRTRPLPSGRVTEEEAFGYALGTFLVGFAFLYVFCGPLPALLSLFTTAVYVFAYTPSKRRGPVSVWIGAVPGAIPPVMGWATVRGALEPEGLALFALMFTWQFPHFLALAYMYRDDYARGGFRFLPEVDTARKTGRDIGLGAIAVAAASLAPFAFGLTSWIYLALALAAGAGFLGAAGRAWRRLSAKTARAAFLASIVYLPVLLVAIVLDRALL
jgi:protoheme IX farnesyltransferase